MKTPNGTVLDDDYAYPLFVKLYDDLREEKTAIAARVFVLLDEEQFNVEVVGTTEFSFVTNYFGKCPQYACDFLKRYIPKHYGLTYVYDRIPL